MMVSLPDGVASAQAPIEVAYATMWRASDAIGGHRRGENANARLEIAPVAGEEIERTVSNLFKLDPAMVAKLGTILLE
jgi:hypothetical protein